MTAYHSKVVPYVLVIIAKKLNEDSVWITEKHSFFWWISSIDDMPRQVVFSDNIVNNGAKW